MIVAESSDNTIKVWSVESGKEIRVFTGHSGWVNSVAISADGKVIVSGSSDNTIKMWSVESGEWRRNQNIHST